MIIINKAINNPNQFITSSRQIDVEKAGKLASMPCEHYKLL